MVLSNPAMIAVSGILIAAAYLIDRTAVPFVVAGVAATWARVYIKGNSAKNKSTIPTEHLRCLPLNGSSKESSP